MSAVLTMPPPVKKYSPDDLFSLPDGGKGFELVDGELRELNVSNLSTYVAGEAYFHLRSHVGSRHLGWVAPEGTSYRCFPDEPGKVRRADCSFHVLSRLTVERATSEGHCTIVPDLVVEVVSPNDLAYEVDEKRLEWLEAGARLVWIIHPVRQNIHAYYADRTVRLFGKTDLLTAEPVLPEFSIPVADLFRLPV